jgi:broad specificity phosphatase PhoE
MAGQISFYLMNISNKTKVIWLTCHGESIYNLDHRIGGDPPLSDKGICFSEALAKFFHHIYPPESHRLLVWSSELQRAVKTASYLSPKYSYSKTRLLNEIDVGTCDNLTYQEIEKRMPHEFNSRRQSKLTYRYPEGGESYLDVIQRMNPIIVELERLITPILLIGHLVTLRSIYGYFKDVSLEDIPFINIKLHTLISLELGPYATIEKRYEYNDLTGQFVQTL